jgi:hypothetical protein
VEGVEPEYTVTRFTASDGTGTIEKSKTVWQPDIDNPGNRLVMAALSLNILIGNKMELRGLVCLVCWLRWLAGTGRIAESYGSSASRPKNPATACEPTLIYFRIKI